MAIKEGWPSYGDTNSADWVELPNTETKAFTYGPETDCMKLERSAEQETENEKNGFPESLEGAGTNERRSVLRARRSFGGLGILLGVVLFALLLAAGFQKLVLPKELVRPTGVDLVTGEAEKEIKGEPAEGAGGSDDARTAEVEARLQKIKLLLPTAKRLALAVSSDEAARLLETVRQSVEKPCETSPQAEDSRALTKALRALRALHQAAIERVLTIVHADKGLPEFPGLDRLDKNMHDLINELEHIPEYRVVPLWVTMHRSLREKAERLTKRFDEVAKQALSGRQFEDEGDKDVLLTTAINLEFLRAESKSRKRVIAAAEDTVYGVISGLKCMFTKKRSGELRSLEENLAALKLYVALLKDSQMGDDPEAIEIRLSDETKACLKDLQDEIKTASFLLGKARTYIEVLRTGTSVPVISLADAKATNLLLDAHAVIEKCERAAALLPKPTNALNAAGKKMAHDMALENLQTLVSGNAALLDVLKVSRQTIIRFYQGIPRKVLRFCNAAIAGAQLDMANKLSKKSSKRLRDTKYSVNFAKNAIDVSSAVQELNSINSSLDLHEKDREAAEMLRLSTRLLVFLEEDIEHTAVEVDNASLQSSYLSSTQLRSFEELQRKFNAARISAEEATTLLETTLAAVEMRSHVLAMQDLLFACPGEEAQRQL